MLACVSAFVCVRACVRVFKGCGVNRAECFQLLVLLGT